MIAKKVIAIFTFVIIVSSILALPIVFMNLGIQINQFQYINPVIELNPDAIPLSDLIPSVENISINGINFTCEIRLWRDFMPAIPYDGPELDATVKIIAVNHSFPVESFRAYHLIVYYQNEYWYTSLELQNPLVPNQNYIFLRASGGPRWETSAYVNVVVELIDNNFQSHRFILRDQYIEVTH